MRYRSFGTSRTSAYGFLTRGAFAAAAATAMTIPALIKKSRLFKKKATLNDENRHPPNHPAAFGSSDTHFVAYPSSALYCRADNFFTALRYRRDVRSALSQNLPRGPVQSSAAVLWPMQRAACCQRLAPSRAGSICAARRLNLCPAARPGAPMSEPGRNRRRAERALLARLRPCYVVASSG